MKSMPASTLSVRRSSTNGSARMIAKCRRFTVPRSHMSG